MTIRYVVPILAVAILSGACKSSHLPTTRPTASAPVVARNSDDGHVVKVAPDQNLVIRLASNPSTGFSWKVAVIDPQYLQQQGERVYEHADPQMIGAGGTDVFTFKAVKKGHTVLVLDYVRPWEKKPAETTFTLNVSIDE